MLKGWAARYSPNFCFQERHRIPINKKRPQPDFTYLITGAKIGLILEASKLIAVGLFYRL